MSHRYGLTANLPPQPLCSMTFLAISTYQPVNASPGERIRLGCPNDALKYLTQAPDPWEKYRATLYLIPAPAHPFYNQDENGAEPYVYDLRSDFFLLREVDAAKVRNTFGLEPNDQIILLSGESNYLGLDMMFRDFEARMSRFSGAMQSLVSNTSKAYQKAMEMQ